MREFQCERVAHDGVSIWVESLQGAEPACLLIGGAGAISSFWPDAFCRELASAGFGVIRFDHRDVGNSSCVDFSERPYELMDLVADVLAVLDARGLGAAHFVGHSMGGFIAQLAAIHHPGRVLSLTSMSSHTASPQLPSPAEETWEVMLANQPVGVLAEDRAGFLEVWRYLNGELPFDEEMAEAYTREIYSRNPRGLPATNHVAIQENMVDRTQALGRVRTPALVIHGERDPLVPFVGALQTVEAVAGARLLALPGAGHMFFNRSVWKKIAVELVTHLRRAAGGVLGPRVRR